MNKKQFTFITLAALLSTGCVTRVIEKTITVKENVYKAVTVSPQYLTPCVKPALFTRDEYVGTDEAGRRKLLVDAVADRNEALFGCDRKIESIGEESKKLSDIINSRKDEPVITESTREYKK